MRITAFAAFIGLIVLCGFSRADNKGTETEFDGLKSQVPHNWKAQESKSQMRILQFLIPKAQGDEHDGEMIVFFFGKGGGGGVDANITRWKGMVTPKEGKKIDDIAKVDKFKVGEIPVTLLDVAGTYLHKSRPFDPSDKGEKRENYRLIGIIIESPNGPFFVRITGPAKTIEINQKGIDAWVRGLR